MYVYSCNIFKSQTASTYDIVTTWGTLTKSFVSDILFLFNPYRGKGLFMKTENQLSYVL